MLTVRTTTALPASLPACACSSAPLSAESGLGAVYRDGDCQTVFDHRSETVWLTADGMAIAITASRDSPSGIITQTQPRIDIITDADKASLTVWMKYMQAVDTAAPILSDRKSLHKNPHNSRDCQRNILEAGLLSSAIQSFHPAVLKYQESSFR